MVDVLFSEVKFGLFNIINFVRPYQGYKRRPLSPVLSLLELISLCVKLPLNTFTYHRTYYILNKFFCLSLAPTTVNVTQRPVTQGTTRLPVPRAPANHQVVYTTLPAPPAQAPLRGAVMQAPAVRQVNPQNSKRLSSCTWPHVTGSFPAFSWSAFC